jgi:hypothetical protein
VRDRRRHFLPQRHKGHRARREKNAAITSDVLRITDTDADTYFFTTETQRSQRMVDLMALLIPTPTPTLFFYHRGHRARREKNAAITSDVLRITDTDADTDAYFFTTEAQRTQRKP